MGSPRKNDFLDASESEDEPQDGYDSENELRKGGRSRKRRKIQGRDGAGSETSEPEDDGSPARSEARQDDENDAGEPLNPKPAATAEERRRNHPAATEPDTGRAGMKKNLVASDKAIRKSGVVYLSRVPPFMKPTKLRSLLEPYGTINRTFLAPEDPAAHARRVRAGGNKKRFYTEAWVEFVNKKDAKAACELLNAHIIGGKKGSYYHDDIWNLVYLKGFKWHNLTEQIAAENAERASRMRAEISKSTRENKEFVQNVERAKMLDGMRAKSRKRSARDAEAESDGERVEAVPASRTRSFKQIPQVRKSNDTEEQPAHVSRALSKIF